MTLTSNPYHQLDALHHVLHQNLRWEPVDVNKSGRKLLMAHDSSAFQIAYWTGHEVKGGAATTLRTLIQGLGQEEKSLFMPTLDFLREAGRRVNAQGEDVDPQIGVLLLRAKDQPTRAYFLESREMPNALEWPGVGEELEFRCNRLENVVESVESFVDQANDRFKKLPRFMEHFNRAPPASSVDMLWQLISRTLPAAHDDDPLVSTTEERERGKVFSDWLAQQHVQTLRVLPWNVSRTTYWHDTRDVLTSVAIGLSEMVRLIKVADRTLTATVLLNVKGEPDGTRKLTYADHKTSTRDKLVEAMDVWVKNMKSFRAVEMDVNKPKKVASKTVKPKEVVADIQDTAPPRRRRSP